jgi:hypothetical protein
VTWANAVNVTVTGNSLQRVAIPDAWNAGAISSSQLNAGDGAAQIQVDSGLTWRMFGLSNGDPDQGYASIKYAWLLRLNGTLAVLESGVSKGEFGSYATGDLLKVEVISGVVRYSRMAAGSGMWTLMYTSTVAPAYPLVLDTSIYTAGAALQNVAFGAGTCPVPPAPTPTSTPSSSPTRTHTNTPTPAPPSAPCAAVTWANAVNVTVSGNNLQRMAIPDAWNAGAISSTLLNAGDGAAQMRVDSGLTWRMFGLSNGDPDQGYASIKYAWLLRLNGTLAVLESGVSKGEFGSYATGDLLKVEVTSGVVRYSRMAAGSGMWTLLYTSTVAPAYPLLLDTSIYTPGAQLQAVYFGAGTCPLPP